MFGFFCADQVEAQTKWRCTCNNGQGTDIGGASADYAPYTSASQYCDYYCAAYLGVNSISLYPDQTLCFDCCCNNGSSNSGTDATSCSAFCASQGGVKSSGAYDCSNPSTVPECTASDACQQCKDACVGTADATACVDDCSNGPVCGGGAGPGTGAAGPGTGAAGPGTGAVPGIPTARVGNTIMPNFIGYDSISALLGAIAKFIVDNIVTPLAVIMIIYSGFLFVTAGGNEEKIKKAKTNLKWTVLGVAIIVASNLLLGYITELLGGPSAGVQPFLTQIKRTLNSLIVVGFALATVYFIWGMVMFMRATGSGDEQGVATGKRHMIWGVIGITVMSGAYGIVNFIKSIFP